MVYDGRENDQCFGFAELLQFPDELIEPGGAWEQDLQQHGIITGDTVAFDDAVLLADIRIEGFLIPQADFQIDEGLDAIIEFLVIDCSMKACDESGIDKAPDSG